MAGTERDYAFSGELQEAKVGAACWSSRFVK